MSVNAELIDATVREILPAVSDAALVQDVSDDLAAGEPLIALVTLVEVVPEVVPASAVDLLDDAISGFDTLTAQIGRKVSAAYRAAHAA